MLRLHGWSSPFALRRYQPAAESANEVWVAILASARWGYVSAATSAQVLNHYDRIVAMLYKLTH